MGIGHAAVALGASRAVPRLNIGVLIFAAFFADFLLGIFAVVGLEQAHIPADFASSHYLTFTFPYSHGLAFLVFWGVLLGAAVCWSDCEHRSRIFIVIALLVISHFFLDALVHVPELPLDGESSPKVGLGLWNQMPIELTVETLMAIGGLICYWRLARNVSAAWRWGIAVFTGLLTVLTWSQLWMKAPPSNSQLITSWIGGVLFFSAIPYVLDCKRVAAQKA